MRPSPRKLLTRDIIRSCREGDENRGLPASDADSGIVLDLRLMQGYDINVKTAADNSDTTPQGQKFTGEKMVGGGNHKYPAHHTLKNLLYKLVQSKGSCYADKKVGFTEQSFNDLPDRGENYLSNSLTLHHGWTVHVEFLGFY